MVAERMGAWNTEYFPDAVEQLGDEALTPAWRHAYTWQITLSELALRHLDVSRDTDPALVPNVGEILNPKPLESGEIGLINVIGMPGAGKDTMIGLYSKLEKKRVLCAPEEGYFWSKEFDPEMKELRKRHLRAYGGTDMEIDEMIDRLGGLSFGEKGVGIMNRSNEDNFLAFAYSFFLSGFMGIVDLITSQKLYHYFQYQPSLGLRDQLVSQDDVTAGTIMLLVNPRISLERKGRSGRILNKKFLGLLYSQYLRMIWRLRADGYRNLAVLDMSGGIEENFSRFREVIDTIIG
jgi:hypothetical protein